MRSSCPWACCTTGTKFHVLAASWYQNTLRQELSTIRTSKNQTGNPQLVPEHIETRALYNLDKQESNRQPSAGIRTHIETRTLYKVTPSCYQRPEPTIR